MALFRLKNDEFDRAREGDLIEHGERPDTWRPIDDEDDGGDDADDLEDDGSDDDG